jgi:RHS repeat-associated protein
LPTALSFISTCDLHDFYTQLSANGYNDCERLTAALYSYYQSRSDELIDLLALHPDIKDIVGGTAFGGSCTGLSPNDVIDAMVTADVEFLWEKIFLAESLSNLIDFYIVNNLGAYYFTISNQNPIWISDYQKNHNMYSSSGTGMEAYFGKIQTYFGQVFYDNLVAKFLNASKSYSDSFRLAEHHIYGSSRLGIYQQYKPLTCRYFNSNASGNELNDQQNILNVLETKSYSLFAVMRGNKRYELSNHASTKLSINLGNVLTVISDKRLITCGSDTVYYYSADIISATDYSPFGAPLASRTYQASEYRFGFNGKENDNEAKGNGNQQDYGMRVCDNRLGRFFSIDPLTKKYPELSTYQFASNIPISGIDQDGLEHFNMTTITYSESGAAIGLGYGLAASISDGTAYDMIGKTYFSAYSALNPNNQDLEDGSRNPKIVYGLDLNLCTVGFNIVNHPTFAKAFNQQAGSSPLSKPQSYSFKLGVGAGISASGSSFGLSVSVGLGAAFRTGSQSKILQSISITYDQVEKVDQLGGIVTLSKPIEVKRGGETFFESSVLVRNDKSQVYTDSGIKVYSRANVVTESQSGRTTLTPDGIFKSDDYKAEEEQINGD